MLQEFDVGFMLSPRRLKLKRNIQDINHLEYRAQKMLLLTSFIENSYTLHNRSNFSPSLM